MTDDLHVVSIRSSRGEYPVHVGPGALRVLRSLLEGHRVVVVSEPGVWERLGDAVAGCLGPQGDGWTLHLLPAGEAAKSLDAVAALWNALVGLGADRATRVVAVGGGTVGDAAGFAASAFHRGVPLVAVPTTLVAQADSALGGKTAINLPGARNAVGSFHPPVAVVADTSLLRSLGARDLASGLAEVVKMALLFDRKLARWLAAHWDALTAADAAALAHAVARSAALKGAVVARDEREERGERFLLNFGHTVGHALEAALGFGVLRHGEAVAAGMAGALELSRRVLGAPPPADAALAADLLGRLLPLDAWRQDFDELATVDRIAAALARDKKHRGGRLRWVLWRGIGQPALVDGIADPDAYTAVEAALHAARAGLPHSSPTR